MRRLSRIFRPLALFSYASAVTYKSFRYFDTLFQRNMMSERALSDLKRHFPDFNLESRALRPRNLFEIEYILKFCNEHQFLLNLEENKESSEQTQLVLDTSQLNQIKKIDSQSKFCSVESGVALQELNRALQKEGLYFPFVSKRTTNESIDTAIYSGFKSILSLRYHSINDNIRTICAVTGSGKTLQTERTLQEGMGLNLKDLFIGSRGVLGVIGQLEIRTEQKPRAFLKLQGRLQLPLKDVIEQIYKTAKEDNMDGLHIRIDQSGPVLMAFRILTNQESSQSKLRGYLDSSSMFESKIESFQDLVHSAELPLLNQDDSVSILIPESSVLQILKSIQGKSGYYLAVRRDCIEIEFKFDKARKEEFDILTSRAIELGGTVRGKPAILKQIDSQLFERVVGVTNYEHKHNLKLLFDPKNLLQTREIFGESPSLRERFSSKHKINKYILEQWLKI